MDQTNDSALHRIKAKNEITQVPKGSVFDAAEEMDVEADNRATHTNDSSHYNKDES